mgnify:CR=1 FL=1
MTSPLLERVAVTFTGAYGCSPCSAVVRVVAVVPAADVALPPLPAQPAHDRTDAHHRHPVPARLIDLQRVLGQLAGRDQLLRHQVILDRLLPRVFLVALILLDREQLALVHLNPPALTRLEPMHRLGPKLAHVGTQALDVNVSTRDRPEAPITRIVFQISIVIHRAGKGASPRLLFQFAAIRRAEKVFALGNEMLGRAGVGFIQPFQFSHFDNPATLQN